MVLLNFNEIWEKFFQTNEKKTRSLIHLISWIHTPEVVYQKDNQMHTFILKNANFEVNLINTKTIEKFAAFIDYWAIGTEKNGFFIPIIVKSRLNRSDSFSEKMIVKKEEIKGKIIVKLIDVLGIEYFFILD